jgi:hypothetical protein
MYILTDYCILTNDRPDLSSERAPLNDKTVTFPPPPKKKYIFLWSKVPKIGLDTKTY